MKAIQFSRFGDRDVLEYIDVPKPFPQNDEVLIEVTASGVNYVDIRERQGIYQRAETHVGKDKGLPRISGLQVVGIVNEVGPTGDQSLIGEKVVALIPSGGYAQFVCAPSNTTVCLPASADDALIAAMPTQGLTAWLMLKASTQLRSGESVLIHGAAGGVGSLAVQLAKSMGAGLVVASASTEEKRAFAHSIGADVTVDYSLPDWPKLVLEATGGRGVDIILESIGGDVFEQNFACLATFGRYIIFGSTRGPGRPFEPRRLMQKCQTMTGIYLPVFLAKPELIRAGLTDLVTQVLKGKLRAQVAAILPLSKTVEAHRLLEERLVVGAIVLDPRIP
ncbi:quinone oxidoreductase family protein [Acidicapsa ligni]|uniref:quinone oxidoreductase family protein n=1 Tax=Acidicapsa ligni TaxID=542300 RepID=UPI0021E0D56F|nr:zinc-binding dehydrogenase [Acidicapsa ligni]